MYKVGITIHDQIWAQDKWAFANWGAKDMVYGDNGVQFKTSGAVKYKGYVVIRLTGNDLYEITFYKLRGINMTNVILRRDIYADSVICEINSIVLGN